MRKEPLTSQEVKIAEHIKAIMEILQIPPTEDNADTPTRVAKMYSRDLFRHRHQDYSEIMSQMTTFKAPATPLGVEPQPVFIRGIKFTSMCSHHWLPFTGYVDISYLPKDNILGLSKFPRAVKYFSKKPNIQEEFTQEIGEFLVNLLDPKSLSITVRDVRHSCVEARGIEAECEVDTHYVYEEVNKHEA